MKRLSLFLLLCLLPISSFSKVPDYFFEQETLLDKGLTVTILDYDRRLGGVFEIVTDKDYGVRNHYTRLGDLSVAVKEITRRKFRKKTERLVGKSFKINKAKLKTYKSPLDVN